jgi:hypothetical protein
LTQANAASQGGQVLHLLYDSHGSTRALVELFSSASRVAPCNRSHLLGIAKLPSQCPIPFLGGGLHVGPDVNRRSLPVTTPKLSQPTRDD